MNPMSIIGKTAAAGVHLAADAGYLEWSCTGELSSHLMELLCEHKAQLLVELERLQWLWLERVSHLLQSTPEHLLQSKMIEPIDMQELWHTEPSHAARLIRSCFYSAQYQSAEGSNR